MLVRTMIRSVMAHREAWLVKKIARLSEVTWKAFENLDHDFTRNGEKVLLERLAAQGLSGVIFDVGANVGDYTRILQGLFPQSAIYAFEIIPATFELLRAHVADLPQVNPINLGLSDEAGEVPIRYYKDCNVLSTMSDFPHAYDYEVVMAQTTTGDRFCVEHAIDEIAFLKIDVEGMENRVLEGLRETLTARKVKVVQFEYGYANALSRFLLRDYYTLFDAYGYRIGKIYPKRIEFKEYDVEDENFWGPNYIAVRNDLVDLQKALSA